MNTRKAIIAVWIGLAVGLLMLYPTLALRKAEAGTSFLTAAQSRIYRTNTSVKVFDPNGTLFVVPFKCGAAPAAASTLFGVGDANDYNAKRLIAQRQTSGTIRILLNTYSSYAETAATGVDANVPQLLTFWVGPRSGSDANTLCKVFLNGGSVVSAQPVGLVTDANQWTTGVGTTAGVATAGFTGELEGVSVIYTADPNSAATVHGIIWNGGDVLNPAAATLTPYTIAHRWRLTGGTPGDTVQATDVYIDDVGAAADGSFDFGTVTSGDANYPEYTASWLITPTTLTVADSNNVTFTGPCVGPWTGGLTYTISGDSTSWTVLAQDANDTWWVADPNAGGEPNSVDIVLTADANALSLGTYTSTIVFDNADTGGLGDTTRTVTLTVWEPNAIALTDPNGATGYTWTFPYGGSDANSFVVGITNGAACEYVANVALDDLINWTIAVPDPNNCTSDGSGGYDCNLPAADDIAFTFELDPNVMPTMPVGSYVSHVTLKPAGDADPNHWTVVPLTVNVTSGSIADPNTRVWTWTETADPNGTDPNQKTVNFTNTGESGTIVFTFNDPNLLNAVSISALCSYVPGLGLMCPIDQDANQMVTLTLVGAVAATIAPGTHNYELWIHPLGDANAPTIVPIQFSVAAAAGGETRYVSPSGSDYGDGGQQNNCLSDGSPCLLVDHAYDEMQDGDTVQCAPGLYWVDGDSVLHADRDIAATFTSSGAIWRNSTTSEPVVLIQTATTDGLSLSGITLDGVQNGLANGSCIRMTAAVDLTLSSVKFLTPSASAFAVYGTAGDVVTLRNGCLMVPADPNTQFMSMSGAATVVIESAKASGAKPGRIGL